ncbi:MAG: tetratricopeptide repeat protein [Candidatus Zixiibacteriota bacterium]
MDFTGFGWTIFWVFAIAAAVFAYLWTRTHKRRTSQAPRLYMEALRALVDGDDRTAFDRLKMTAQEDSNNLDAYLKLGDLLRRRGRIDRAIKVHQELNLRRGFSKNDIIAVQKSLALDYVASGDHTAAERSLLKIIEVDKENAWAADQLVALYAHSGRFDAAFDYRRAAVKRSGKADGHTLAIYKTLAGASLSAAGKKHDARVAYKEALSFDEHCIPALLYLGDAYWDDGEPEDAVEWWTRLAAARPEAAQMVFDRLERAYFELGQYGEINKFYERILDKNPNDAMALLGLANLSLKKGEFDHALRRYRQVLEIDPVCLPARAGIIRALAQQSRWQQIAQEVDSLLGTGTLEDEGYTCSRCGHREPEPAWYCPQCKAVESYGIAATSQSVTTKA